MRNEIVDVITNSSKRKSFFHFTRVRNLPSVAHLDALYACHKVDPTLSNERRSVSREIHLDGHVFIANAHLRITDQVMDASITHQQFHSYLDQHVFFWPTQRDCQKMLEMYARREPDEDFVILQLDAHALLSDFYDTVKLSKYDSGSSPRYPNRCAYKKSLQMFVTLDQFELVRRNDVPTKPSEIREVLVEQEVTQLSRYLQYIYCDQREGIPGRWRELARSIQDFKEFI
ncbi:hypothetical protein ASG89_12920 [Paenibacillus sp. Soil766]|uniref:DUF7002 family protein n=1 Tax=Paenibacillus sp. Soil766 TaxID=1736404 RepID=UPI00070E4D09|nr:hypothetical protein [Paenibacillus sp. Soil766]KRE83030.1 hypothetical protein ASG89_12920 [Paenibacillus sp. Soil766]